MMTKLSVWFFRERLVENRALVLIDKSFRDLETNRDYAGEIKGPF
jgi:hypothetical protein